MPQALRPVLTRTHMQAQHGCVASTMAGKKRGRQCLRAETTPDNWTEEREAGPLLPCCAYASKAYWHICLHCTHHCAQVPSPDSRRAQPVCVLVDVDVAGGPLMNHGGVQVSPGALGGSCEALVCCYCCFSGVKVGGSRHNEDALALL